MEPAVADAARPVRAVLPGEVVRAPAGSPVVLVARTGRGWTVLCADPVTGWTQAAGGMPENGVSLTLVEGMALADLVAGELGGALEPDREARRAARTTRAGTTTTAEPTDPRAAEVATLRRTVGQLEHALAARVTIERAIGVLAERHRSTPREAFEELRRRARAQGRPAQQLAAEVLDGLPTDAVGSASSATVPGALR
jgi:ANTAR domain-containing protein